MISALYKGVSRVLPMMVLLFGSQLFVSAQDIITASGDIRPGTSIFVFKKPKSFFSTTASASKPVKKVQQTSSNTKPAQSIKKPAVSKPEAAEPIAPEDWINEQADNAIEERKTSDSEPFLSLSEGYLNSRAYFCESPQFPAAARATKQKLVNSKVLVTVAKYGGLLQARTIEGNPAFRSSVYKTLGSMSFRQSYFMGKPIRIEGVLNFTQNPANTVLCRESAQELEVPAVIDGDVLNEMATSCEFPEFPADARTANLKTVEAKIQVIVDEQGKVIHTKILGGHPTFAEAAVKSAMRATFPKSVIAGKPVKVRGILVFTQNPNNDVRCGKTTAE
jgi:hypothetical protein